MSILNNICIRPLIFVYDLLYTLFSRAFLNPATAIIALSVTINFLVLPLYNKADAMQKEEQAKKLAMEPWVKHIKTHFHGDEQFMMLQKYYKIEHYSPFSFLKEAVPLLLQVPFFVAAYQFFSSLTILDGASFGHISDLMKPDHLLVIGSVSINVLPILMTLINLISGVIYSKSSTRTMKVQMLVTALLFLMLLYNSPSGLVIYWTMNNIFSLLKNIVSQYNEKQKKAFKIILAFAILVLAEYLVLNNRISIEISEIIIIGSITYIIIQICGKMLFDHIRKRFQIEKIQTGKSALAIVLASEMGLSVLLGMYIPSTVLASSIQEFTDQATGTVSYELLTIPALTYLGLVMIWFTVIYFSNSYKGRTVFTIVISSAFIFALLNQFVFSKSFGTLYTDLQFDEVVQFPIVLIILNFFAGLLCFAICGYVLIKKPYLLRAMVLVLSLALIIVTGKNVVKICNPVVDEESRSEQVLSYDGILHLSKSGKNIIVFMLDKAIGTYVPFIFDEKPDLKEAYRGFVFYPNTISFGAHTNFGSPGLFGGYEYIPTEMNKRNTESLKDKHNEALKLMPVMFSNSGYDVIVADPPYAGYKMIPDLSVYDDYPEIEVHRLRGKFSEEYSSQFEGNNFEAKQKRNFLVYSLYRVAPLFLRSSIYDDGKYIYNSAKNIYSNELIANYSTLAKLCDLTSIDEKGNFFLLLQNETPHDPAPLDPPDYEVRISTTDTAAEHKDKTIGGRTMSLQTETQWAHYCTNVATYQVISKWLNYLKEKGVYDNTRIILVADHGYYLNQFSDMLHPKGLDVESLNPLLMIKDFDAHDPWMINTEFMTNADVPYLATKDVIENPVNPFTGNAIVDVDKNGVQMFITDSNNWSVEKNNGYIFDLTNAHWWSVHDNLFDMDNWEKLEGVAIS